MKALKSLTLAGIIVLVFAEANNPNMKDFGAGSENSMRTVAVIGGGAAGILSARELQKLGYNTAIYEAKGRVGGLSTTISNEGFKYDLATVFMSSGDFETQGLTAGLAELLDEAGLSNSTEVFEAGVEVILQPEQRQTFFPPSILNAVVTGMGQDVIDQFANGLQVLESIVLNDVQGVAAAGSSDIDIDLTETVDNWASRV